MNDSRPLQRVVVPGSERVLPASVEKRAVDLARWGSVTVVVRPKTSALPVAAALTGVDPAARAYLSREAFAQTHGADPADVLAVQRFAVAQGLLVSEADLGRRSVVLAGSVGALAAAFGADLHECRLASGATFRGRSGTLTVPADVAPLIEGVFGLDERPQARAQFRRLVRPAAAAATSYTPPQIASAYGFPGSDGAGQTIALIELGGGYVQADLDAYFSKLGVRTPVVRSVSVDGGINAPAGDPASADAEVLLDIEVAGAIVPGAALVVYFAPNTDQGFLDAVTTAIHDATNKPQIVSISWGGPESTWTAQALKNFDAAFADAATLGVTVLCAAGDNGSSDGVTGGAAHVDFPASSPHVLACGGTRLTLAGTAIASETVWNDGAAGGATGGGVSDVFDLPAWQQTAGVPPSTNAGARVGRGVPDIAGDADPQTGYQIRVDGSDGVVGGTSAVAPLWAALVAQLNARAAKPLGFVNGQLYANPGALRDILTGSNGAYAAGPGWDACTGLGTPDGSKLAAVLVPQGVTP